MAFNLTTAVEIAVDLTVQPRFESVLALRLIRPVQIPSQKSVPFSHRNTWSRVTGSSAFFSRSRMLITVNAA